MSSNGSNAEYDDDWIGCDQPPPRKKFRLTPFGEYTDRDLIEPVILGNVLPVPPPPAPETKQTIATLLAPFKQPLIIKQTKIYHPRISVMKHHKQQIKHKETQINEHSNSNSTSHSKSSSSECISIFDIPDSCWSLIFHFSSVDDLIFCISATDHFFQSLVIKTETWIHRKVVLPAKIYSNSIKVHTQNMLQSMFLNWTSLKQLDIMLAPDILAERVTFIWKLLCTPRPKIEILRVGNCISLSGGERTAVCDDAFKYLSMIQSVRVIDFSFNMMAISHDAIVNFFAAQAGHVYASMPKRTSRFRKKDVWNSNFSKEKNESDEQQNINQQHRNKNNSNTKTKNDKEEDDGTNVSNNQQVLSAANSPPKVLTTRVKRNETTNSNVSNKIKRAQSLPSTPTIVLSDNDGDDLDRKQKKNESDDDIDVDLDDIDDLIPWNLKNEENDQSNDGIISTSRSAPNSIVKPSANESETCADNNETLNSSSPIIVISDDEQTFKVNAKIKREFSQSAKKRHRTDRRKSMFGKRQRSLSFEYRPDHINNKRRRRSLKGPVDANDAERERMRRFFTRKKRNRQQNAHKNKKRERNKKETDTNKIHLKPSDGPPDVEAMNRRMDDSHSSPFRRREMVTKMRRNDSGDIDCEPTRIIEKTNKERVIPTEFKNNLSPTPSPITSPIMNSNSFNFNTIGKTNKQTFLSKIDPSLMATLRDLNNDELQLNMSLDDNQNNNRNMNDIHFESYRRDSRTDYKDINKTKNRMHGIRLGEKSKIRRIYFREHTMRSLPELAYNYLNTEIIECLSFFSVCFSSLIAFIGKCGPYPNIKKIEIGTPMHNYHCAPIFEALSKCVNLCSIQLPHILNTGDVIAFGEFMNKAINLSEIGFVSGDRNLFKPIHDILSKHGFRMSINPNGLRFIFMKRKNKEKMKKMYKEKKKHLNKKRRLERSHTF